MRILTIATVLLTVSCGSGPIRPAPIDPTPGETTPPVTRYDARTFFETTSAFVTSFSYDETQLLLGSDESGIFNVYAQPVTGGRPQPLTKSTSESLFPIRYFPKDNRFLYSADTGGNELSHIFVVEPGGKAVDLTPGDKVKAGFRGFTQDDKWFFIRTNERDPAAMDLYRYAVHDYKRTLVFENSDKLTLGPISHNGRWLALVKQHDNANSDIYLVDLASADGTAAPKLVTPHTGNVEHAALTFTPDNEKLVYQTNAHGEFAQAWTYHVETAAHAPLVKDDWDIQYVVYSKTGKYRVSATNSDARTVLTLFDTASDKPLVLPKIPAGDITGVLFSPSETKLALHVRGDRSPTNVFVVDLASGKLTQLTNTLNPKIDTANLVDGEVIRYKSYDGLEIPSILYRPKGASARFRVPALVFVHGGPGGQSRLGYRAMFQHLVNHGYALLAVNNRGSSGYGKTFYHMDDRKHGDVDLRDCVQAKTYLQTLDWIDGERIGIMGGSYGGYMVLAALAFKPDVFAVGIDIFGVANWLRTLESIPAWWASFRKALYAEMGDPKTDRERLHRISPLFHAKNIKRPLLVVQGANDPRVLKVESDEIVAAVKANNVPVEYVVFEDEGHGFLKRSNQVKASNAYLAFLAKHLAPPD